MADMVVRWAEVVGFPLYEVSNDGRVRRMWKTKAPQELRIQGHPDCRFGVVKLMAYGRHYQRSVSRLAREHHPDVELVE